MKLYDGRWSWLCPGLRIQSQTNDRTYVIHAQKDGWTRLLDAQTNEVVDVPPKSPDTPVRIWGPDFPEAEQLIADYLNGVAIARQIESLPWLVPNDRDILAHLREWHADANLPADNEIINMMAAHHFLHKEQPQKTPAGSQEHIHFGRQDGST